MSAMARHAPFAVLLTAAQIFAFLSISLLAQGQDVQQHLRDQYQGKTFVLRGFYSGDHLRYDSSGAPDNTASGDWTVDGFVQVNDIHISDDRVIIKAQRMVAAQIGGQFQLRPLERGKGNSTKRELVQVEVEADPGMHNPAPEQLDALFSKIFLTSQDSLAEAVPDYWKACLRESLKGTDKNCAFAAELLAVPGIAASAGGDNASSVGTAGDARGPAGDAFRVGRGVTPPRVVYQRDPEFSDAARASKFQGTAVLWLVVDKDGVPRNIRISKPLGFGLDEKAVQAVSEWKFKPSEKDGIPVNVAIAVEVDFHLY
jgi:TonB family protein